MCLMWCCVRRCVVVRRCLWCVFSVVLRLVVCLVGARGLLSCVGFGGVVLFGTFAFVGVLCVFFGVAGGFGRVWVVGAFGCLWVVLFCVVWWLVRCVWVVLFLVVVPVCCFSLAVWRVFGFCWWGWCGWGLFHVWGFFGVVGWLVVCRFGSGVGFGLCVSG